MTRILGLACMLGLTSTVASAATLTTPPFPGLNVFAGSVLCTATNVGTSDAVVTFELLDDYGSVISSSRDFPLPPGRTYSGVGASLASTSASFCRFKVSGRVRASFVYLVNGTASVVIPATK